MSRMSQCFRNVQAKYRTKLLLFQIFGCSWKRSTRWQNDHPDHYTQPIVPGLLGAKVAKMKILLKTTMIYFLNSDAAQDYVKFTKDIIYAQLESYIYSFAFIFVTNVILDLMGCLGPAQL